MPDEAIEAVLQSANRTLGADFFKTPRDVVRSFVQLINILEQNPGTDWKKLLADGIVKKSANPLSAEESIQATGGEKDDEGFAAFKL